MKTERQLRCDVCGELATMFVICDPRYFRSFRCEQHGREAINALEIAGHHARVEGIVGVSRTVADATGCAS